MLHWSTVPEEYVFDGWDTAEYNWVETEVQGVKMLVEPSAEMPGYGKVVRLLCPKPASYMNPNLQPGSLVCLIR